jgi:hypothetical protein
VAESLKVMVSMPDMLSPMASANVDLAIHIAPQRAYSSHSVVSVTCGWTLTGCCLATSLAS